MANEGTTTQNIKVFEPGEYICSQGQDSDELYILKSGKVHVLFVEGKDIISKSKVESEGILVGEISQPNSFIGEIGVILGESRSASIKAAEKTEIIVINVKGKGIGPNVIQNPKLGIQLAKTIAGRLSSAAISLHNGDSLALKIKERLDDYSKHFYEIINSITDLCDKHGIETKEPEEAKQLLAYQYGQISAQYGTVPIEIYTALTTQFTKHAEIFANRIFMDIDKETETEEKPTERIKGGIAKFSAGEIICKEEEPDENLYILLEGKLEVLVGMRAIEIIEGKNSIFGEMALLGSQPRSSSIMALTDIQAMAIPAAGIDTLLHQKPQLMLPILQGFARRLPNLNRVTLKTTRQLAQLVKFLGESENSCVANFANFIGKLKADNNVTANELLLQEIKNLETFKGQIENEFKEIETNYEHLCKQMEYKSPDTTPKQEKPEFSIRFNKDVIFVNKFEDIKGLDSEHINFFINPQNKMVRCCSIEFSHQELFNKLKISKEEWKTLFIGRIHNFGENYPYQFITIDTTSLNTTEKKREDIISVIENFFKKLPQEIGLLFKESLGNEIMYLPDFIKSESEELADESQILELISKLKTNPEDRDALLKLNSKYWDLVMININKNLPKVKDETVPFDAKEQLLINFGLIDSQFLPKDSNVLAQIEEDRKFDISKTDISFLYLTDYLQDAYKENFGYTKSLALEGERKDAGNKLSGAKERIEFLRQTRLEMIASFPDGKEQKNIATKIDDLVNPIAVLERKSKSKQLSPEERTQQSTLKTDRTNLQKQLDTYLTGLKGKASEDTIAEFRTMGEELFGEFEKVMNAEEALAKKEELIIEHKNWLKALTLKTKETTYKNEIARLKTYLTVSAKKVKSEPIAVLTNVKNIATRAKVLEIINTFLSENVDPDIFNPEYNQRIKKSGKPSFMLIPGTGVSVYDWSKNVILVPLTTPGTIEESLANAFIEYHFDIDEDRALRDSFGQIKTYKGLGMTKLKDAFVKDYIKWATKEAKGSKVLEREVRIWFQTKLAHQKIKQG